jgi:hypothetical protein
MSNADALYEDILVTSLASTRITLCHGSLRVQHSLMVALAQMAGILGMHMTQILHWATAAVCCNPVRMQRMSPQGLTCR